MTGVQTCALPICEKTQQILKSANSSALQSPVSFAALLRRPEITYEQIQQISQEEITLTDEVLEEVEIEIKYEGYIKKQRAQVQRFEKVEGKVIPDDLNYQEIRGLAVEARQKLESIRPLSVGQASRISGVNPSDIAVLLVYLEKIKRGQKERPD